MNVKPTPSPWHLAVTNDLRIVDSDEENIAVAAVHDGDRAVGVANAQHIVRCVNAHDELVQMLLGCFIDINVLLDDDAGNLEATRGEIRRVLAKWEGIDADEAYAKWRVDHT